MEDSLSFGGATPFAKVKVLSLRVLLDPTLPMELRRFIQLCPYVDTGSLTTHEAVTETSAVLERSEKVATYCISPTLAALHWLPIRFCASFKVMMTLTYKALNSLGPH